jgi:MFS family permease
MGCYTGGMASFFFRSGPLPTNTAFALLSVVVFFLSGSVSLTIYIDSSFLKNTILNSPALSHSTLWSNPDHMVGTIYALASLLTILLITAMPSLLKRMGNYRISRNLILVYIALLVGLSMSESGWLLLPMFVVGSALVSVIYYHMDIYIEHYSKDEVTGKIRGLFMVIGSSSWLFAPLIAGYLVENFGFPIVYMSAAIVMLPVLVVIMYAFHGFEDSPYHDADHHEAFRTLVSDRNIRNNIIIAVLLQFFYSWMVIYAPIYLADTLGWHWEDIGLMLTIALTSFVIFPYFVGRLADTVLGEKELMVAGLLLMALGTFGIPHLAAAGAGFALWTTLFFVGRAGASVLETMCDTYFFKHVDGGNAALVSYYRRTRPTAYIIGPLIASFLLKTGMFTIEGLFTLLGFIMLAAIYFPLRIKDTL